MSLVKIDCPNCGQAHEFRGGVPHVAACASCGRVFDETDLVPAELKPEAVDLKADSLDASADNLKAASGWLFCGFALVSGIIFLNDRVLSAVETLGAGLSLFVAMRFFSRLASINADICRVRGAILGRDGK